jgi:outer membrane protein TolC
MPRLVIALMLILVSAPSSSLAQTRLTLAEAIARARANNLEVQAAAGAEREADARVSAVRGAFLPKVDLAESWQRGDQPVFVFSSLLSQRQFTAANFAIDALNHPPATNNFRTALTVDQAVYSPSTNANLRTARIGLEIAGKQRTALNQTLAVAVTDAYGRVLVAVASRQVAAASIAAATADRDAASNRRDAGRATDADVLQVDVYLARVREQQIRADADERIARATLNDLMGVALDSTFELDGAQTSAVAAPVDPAALETEALANRPDLQIAALHEQLASASRDAARAAFLPQVSAQAGWEFNGAQWDSRASGWLVGAVARVNLFQGLADRARLTEATEQGKRRALERAKAQNAVRLEVRTALARLDEASAREAAGRASVAQARESQRIIRDRYESGLADVVALLRAAEAVQEADARQTTARVDVVIASAALDRARGK